MPVVPLPQGDGGNPHDPVVGSQIDTAKIMGLRKCADALLKVVQGDALAREAALTCVRLIVDAADGYESSVENLQALMFTFPSSMVEIDPTTGVVVDARLNPITGAWTSLDKLVGRPLWSLLPDHAEADLVKEAIKQAWETGRSGPLTITLPVGSKRMAVLTRVGETVYSIAYPIPA